MSQTAGSAGIAAGGGAAPPGLPFISFLLARGVTHARHRRLVGHGIDGNGTGAGAGPGSGFLIILPLPLGKAAALSIKGRKFKEGSPGIKDTQEGLGGAEGQGSLAGERELLRQAGQAGEVSCGGGWWD